MNTPVVRFKMQATWVPFPVAPGGFWVSESRIFLVGLCLGQSG